MTLQDELADIDARVDNILRELRETLAPVAAACEGCGGVGQVAELWEVFLLSDAPKYSRFLHPAVKSNPRVVRLACGAGRLVVPCERCATIRRALQLAEFKRELS